VGEDGVGIGLADHVGFGQVSRLNQCHVDFTCRCPVEKKYNKNKYFSIFKIFLRNTLCWPLLFFRRPFLIFHKYLDSNPVCYCSMLVRYRANLDTHPYGRYLHIMKKIFPKK
jgi:hypothetical protein